MNDTIDAIDDQNMIDAVESIIATAGYDVHRLGEGMLAVKDVDCGITMQAALEGQVLFMSVVCVVVPAKAITTKLMRKMLDADNGISTSGFQLYQRPDRSVAITLNNFAKLQELGPDDEDDITSCLEFLIVDVLAAKELLGDQLLTAEEGGQ